MALIKDHFIPFKFFDNSEKNITEVYCRGVETETFIKFTLRASSWLIVDPFRYTCETDEEKIAALQILFGTTYVSHDPCDRFLVKNYIPNNVNESDFKYISYLPNSYSTKIAMNKKRYYNLFTESGEWTEERGRGYKNMQNHHLLIKVGRDMKIEYKKPGDSRYEVLTSEIWTLLADDIDLIFSDMPKEYIETQLEIHFENNIDYCQIAEGWIPEDGTLQNWYNDNISGLYEMSFLSARNISDIVCIDSSASWAQLTEDILLSVNIPLFETAKTNRFPKNFAAHGKYTGVYCYRLGDYLLKLMESSTCKDTIEMWKKFSRLSKWSNVIGELFNYNRLNPLEFILPENCIYIDNNYIFMKTQIPLIEHIAIYDYTIVMAEGSYITFNISTKKSKFHGLHPLCRPLFTAGKRCIENYMLCSARNFEIKTEAISDLTDKTSDSLKIMVQVTPANLAKYQRYLPRNIIEKFDKGGIDEMTVFMWFGESMNELTTIFDPSVCIKTSNQYLDHLMHMLDKIR
jgi:hypothetical protein